MDSSWQLGYGATHKQPLNRSNGLALDNSATMFATWDAADAQHDTWLFDELQRR